MIRTRTALRLLALGSALSAISACSDNPALIDWDLRPDGAGTFSTAEAARSATAARPMPDANGVISYPGYQVAVARPGDTVSSVAARTGMNPAELASYNAMPPDAQLNAGEILALPRRVDASSTQTAGATVGAPIESGTIEVTSLASGAIDRAQSDGTATAAAPAPWHRAGSSRSATVWNAARPPIPLPGFTTFRPNRLRNGTGLARIWPCAKASTC